MNESSSIGAVFAKLSRFAIWSALSAAASAVAGPLCEQRFNDNTGIEYLAGADPGPEGSGVSGQGGDKAYTADTQVNPRSVGVVPAVQQGLETDEITVTAWYKPRSDMAGATTLFNAFGTVLIWDEKARQWVWRVEAGYAEPQESPYWFYSGRSPKGDWGTPGDWTFIALVWKRDGNWAGFYQGDREASATLVRQMNRTAEVSPLRISESEKNTVGNDRHKSERAFNGEIDNIRFFAGSLDEEAIERIRKADLGNLPVTVP